jgi:hypothetical protein
VHQIECVKDNGIWSPTHGEAERLKIGYAIAILHDGLTINDGRLALQIESGINDRGIAVGPVVSVPGQDASLSTFKDHLAAVAIVLDARD